MKKFLMMAAMAAHAALAANWTGLGGDGLLENGGNWSTSPDPPGSGSPATFGFDGNATLTTATGFTNSDTTVYATNCTVTFDIPAGMEYAMSSLTLRPVQTAAVPYPTVLTGGGDFCTTWLSFGSSDNHLLVSGARFNYTGSSITFGRDSASATGLSLEEGATMGQEGSVIEFRIGDPTDYNTVTVDSGAILSNALVYVGANGGSFNRFVIGSNACVVGSQTFMVTYAGKSNTLHVMNGGTLTCGSFNVGSQGNAVGNSALIEGAATTFAVNGMVYAGSYGHGNLLAITDVPHPVMNTLTIGNGESGDIPSNNRMVVTGVGELGVSGNVNIGNVGGVSNRLEIVNSGVTVGGNIRIGSGMASYNVMEVTGSEPFYVNSLNVGGGVSNRVEMSGVPVTVTGSVSADGAGGNLLRFAGGVTLNVTGMSVNGGNNRIEIAGETTTADVGGPYSSFGFGGSSVGSVVRIAEGAQVTVSSVGINGMSNRVEVSGGMLEVAGYAGSPGGITAQWRMTDNGSHNVLSVTDGGAVIIRGACYIGIGSPSNHLEVASRATFEIVGNSLYVPYQNFTPSNCTLTVDDATVKVPNGFLELGLGAAFTLRGADPSVKVGTALQVIAGGAAIRYDFGKSAPANAIVEAATMTVAGPVTLELNAEKLGKAGGAKGIVLMHFANAPSPSVWDAVTNSVTVISGQCKVTVGNGGRDLLCDVAGDSATRILVR